MKNSPANFSVLFVCMGNICRSPTAHGVFKRKLMDAGMAHLVKVDSAGTHNYHPGTPCPAADLICIKATNSSTNANSSTTRAVGRYHLQPHAQRLAVSGRRARLVCAQGGGLGNGVGHAGWAGVPGTATCHRATQTGTRLDRAFRCAAASSASASAAHQALLAKHGLIGSMSRKGRCWDNAVIKRLFLNLKMERVWQNDYANHAKATNDIADYIVSFYNTVRLRFALGNLPSNAFEHQASSIERQSHNLSACAK